MEKNYFFRSLIRIVLGTFLFSCASFLQATEIAANDKVEEVIRAKHREKRIIDFSLSLLATPFDATIPDGTTARVSAFIIGPNGKIVAQRSLNATFVGNILRLEIGLTPIVFENIPFSPGIYQVGTSISTIGFNTFIRLTSSLYAIGEVRNRRCENAQSLFTVYNQVINPLTSVLINLDETAAQLIVPLAFLNRECNESFISAAR